MISQIIAIIIFFGVLTAIAIMIVKGKKSKEKYDEMQQKYIGNAYKYAYSTAMALLFGCIIIDANVGFNLPQYSLSSLLVWVCAISFSVFIIYSIWHDAYFLPNQNCRNYLGLTIGLSILYTVLFIKGLMKDYGNDLDMSTLYEIILFRNSTNAALALCPALASVFIIIKMIKEKKEEAENGN